MDSADLDLLLSHEGLALIDQIDAAALRRNPATIIDALRRSGSAPELVRAAADQALLRERAVAKFGAAAARMLFTRAGLEQATRREVAAVHAARFVRAGISEVVDLGCGVGGDAMAFAASGLTVAAVDRDPVTAAIAAYNLRPFGDQVRVACADAQEVPIDPSAGVWLDPARRTTGHTETSRVSAAEYSPPMAWIESLLGSARATAVKLSPAHDRDTIPHGVEAQWISHDGATVELVLYGGSLARAGIGRAAIVIRGGSVHELTSPSDTDDEPVRDLGGYLHEPDGAVIRARLIGDVARALNAGPVAEQIAYLTSDDPLTSPFVTTFRVREELPASPGPLKKALRARGIGRLEIKKRGVDVDPATLRRALTLRGDNEATLIVTRIGGRRTAILADRLERPTPA